MQRQQWYFSLLSIVMTLAIVFVLLLNLKPNYTRHVQHPLSTAHTYMIGVEATRFDQLGDLAEKISVQQLAFNETLQETTFIKPAVTRYRQNIATWQLDADNGTGYHKQNGFSMEHILLHDNVRIQQLQSVANKVPWRLLTNELELTQHLAKTEHPVLIKGPGLNNIESQGLKADFLNGKIQLLNHVASVYDKKAL